LTRHSETAIEQDEIAKAAPGRRLGFRRQVVLLTILLGPPLLLFALGGWTIVPSLFRLRYVFVCQRQLQRIVSQAHFADAAGVPREDAIAWLVANDYISPEDTVCPSHHGRESHYILCIPPTLVVKQGITFHAREPVAMEWKENHGDGGNVVFADGHSEFVKSPGYEALAAECQKVMRKDDGEPTTDAPAGTLPSEPR